MTNKNHYCVIMAGGLDDHLWPLSRERRPNQFIYALARQISAYQHTYERCKQLVPKENILVVTLERFKDFIPLQTPEIPKENVLLEPINRHTAPCVVYSTLSILKRNPDAVIAMVPADQVVEDSKAFEDTMAEAFGYASTHDVLTTVGVLPTRPDPNYGYIQVIGGKAARDSKKPVQVKTFTEKPIPSIAKAFCESNEFFWNTGIYIWKGSVIKEECEKHLPEMTSLFEKWADAAGAPEERSLLERAYDDSEKISIDYGIMEKTDRAWVVPAKFVWLDIDGWNTLSRGINLRDDEGNVLPFGPHLVKDCKDCLFYSRGQNKLLAVRGLENYLVIDTGDVLLICPKDEDLYKDFVSGTGFPEYEKFR